MQGGGKTVTVTIGRLGDTLPDGSKLKAARARIEAQDIRAMLKRGSNPNELKRSDRADALKKEAATKAREQAEHDLVLRNIFELFLQGKKHQGKTLKPSTAYVYRCDFEKCFKDWLDKPIASITEDLIEARHNEISKLHRGQANHAFRILRAVFNFAAPKYKDENGERFIKYNPVRRLSESSSWHVLKPREDFIEDHQLASWFKAVQNLQNPTASDWLIFTLLTGLRKSESGGLLWADVDFESLRFLVRDTKNSKDHMLPITPYVAAMLRRRWETRESEVFVFPASGKRGYMYRAEHLNDAILKESGIKMSPHSLRRTFSTAAARFLPEYLVKAITNHIDSADVTQGYVKMKVNDFREPLALVENHLLKHACVIAE